MTNIRPQLEKKRRETGQIFKCPARLKLQSLGPSSALGQPVVSPRAADKTISRWSQVVSARIHFSSQGLKPNLKWDPKRPKKFSCRRTRR